MRKTAFGRCGALTNCFETTCSICNWNDTKSAHRAHNSQISPTSLETCFIANWHPQWVNLVPITLHLKSIPNLRYPYWWNSTKVCSPTSTDASLTRLSLPTTSRTLLRTEHLIHRAMRSILTPKGQWLIQDCNLLPWLCTPASEKSTNGTAKTVSGQPATQFYRSGCTWDVAKNDKR